MTTSNFDDNKETDIRRTLYLESLSVGMGKQTNDSLRIMESRGEVL